MSKIKLTFKHKDYNKVNPLHEIGNIALIYEFTNLAQVNHYLTSTEYYEGYINIGDLDVIIHNLSTILNLIDFNVKDTNLKHLQILANKCIKCRHNIFATFCSLDMDLPTKFETDADLSKYGIDQTPDICIEDDDSFRIYEISISSSVTKTFFQKGGLNLEKYKDLAEKLKELTGKKVERNLYYLDTTSKKTNYVFRNKVCQDLFQRWIDTLDNYNTCLKLSQTEDAILPGFITYEAQRVLEWADESIKCKTQPSTRIVQTVTAPPGFCSYFLKYRDYLMESLKTTSGPKIICLFERGAIKWMSHDEGVYRDEILFDLEFILERMLFVKRGKKVDKYKFNKDDEPVGYKYNRRTYLEQETSSLTYPHDEELPPVTDDIPIYDYSEIKNRAMKSIINRLDDFDTIVSHPVNSDQIEQGIEEFKQMCLVNPTDDRWNSNPYAYYLFDPNGIKFQPLEETISYFKSACFPALYSYFPVINWSNPNRRTTRNVLNFEYSIKLQELNKQIHQEKERIWELKKNKMPVNYQELIHLKRKVSILYNNARTHGGMKEEAVLSYKVPISNRIHDTAHSHWDNKDMKNKRKVYEGDFDVEMYIKKLFSIMIQDSNFEFRRNIEDLLFKLDSGEDNELFRDLTNITIEKALEVIGKYKLSNMLAWADLNSRLCYNLMYLSQTSHNNEHIMISNLGSSDVLLLVRGGKKIFKTRRSREYNLLLPVNDEIMELYFPSGFDRTSIQTFVHNNRTYMIHPTKTMHEVELQHGLTFYSMLINYLYVMLTRCEEDSKMGLDTSIMWPVALAFHSRRRTEAALHSLRYPLANTFGSYSDLTAILPELAIYPKDCFQHTVNQLFIKNYPIYYKSISKKIVQLDNGMKGFKGKLEFNHPFTGELISGDTRFTNTIYSTYMMVKSPTSQVISQVHNLHKMMEIHKEFKDQTEGLDWLDQLQYFDNKELVKSNFYFSTEMSYLSGRQMASYFKNMNLTNEFHLLWADQLNKSWITVANSSGLRYKGKEFFGNKGHFVVTEEVIRRLDITELGNLLDHLSKFDRSKQVQYFKSCDYTYLCRIQDNEPLEIPIFHVVDKWQRGGDREIYVMDLDTKTYQQPLEGFFAAVCKKVPHEMISVPSNNRLSHVHSAVFERDKIDTETHKLYATLDCKRWAPQCNTNKYIWFVLGLSEVLPESFVKYFLYFMSKYNKKRVYISEMAYIAFTNNKSYSEYTDYLVRDNNRGAYYFEMPYSFIMGIMNYLSSLMHAAQVLTVNSLVYDYFSESGVFGYFKANILVHSDDSAGRFIATSKNTLMKGIEFYQKVAKSMNHIFSIKKCNLSTCYFEFLSILYMSKRLLPTISKFASNLELDPSDDGPSADLVNLTSKTIEYISMGATLSEAIIKKRLMACDIMDFFKIPWHRDLLPQSLGFPLSHPIMDMIAGSNSDAIRLMYKDMRLFTSNVLAILCFNHQQEELKIPFLKSRVEIKRKDKLIKQEEKLKEFLSPIINTMGENTADIVRILCTGRTNHVLVGLFKYLSLYTKQTYQSSLMYEDKTRRISRSMHNIKNMCYTDQLTGSKYNPREAVTRVNKLSKAFSGDLILSKSDLTLLNEENKQIMEKIKENLELNFDTLIKFYSIVSDIRTDSIEVNSFNSSFKPVYISFQNCKTPLTLDCNPSQIAMSERYPEWTFLTTPFKDCSRDVNLVKKFFNLGDQVDTDLLMMYCQKFQKFNIKDFNIYSQVSSTKRVIRSVEEFINYISENSFYKKRVSKFFYKTVELRTIEEMAPQFSDHESHIIKDRTNIFIKELTRRFGGDYEYELTGDDHSQLLVNQHNLLNSVKVLNKESYESMNYLYNWEKTQVRYDEKWFGGMIVHLKLGNMVISLYIDKDKVYKIDLFNCTLGPFSSLDYTVIYKFLNFLNVQLSNKLAESDDLIYLGNRNIDGYFGLFKGKDCQYGVPVFEIPVDPLFKQLKNAKKIHYKPNEYKFGKNKFKLYNGKQINLFSVLELWNYDNNFVINLDKGTYDSWFGDSKPRILEHLFKLNIIDRTEDVHKIVDDLDQTGLRFWRQGVNEFAQTYDYDKYLKDGDSTGLSNAVREFLKKAAEDTARLAGVGSIYDQLLLELKISPESVPQSIRKNYLENCIRVYMTNNIEEYCEDLYHVLINISNKAALEDFMCKWGNENLKQGVRTAYNSNLELNRFDLMKDPIVIHYNKNSLMCFLMCLDQLYRNRKRSIEQLILANTNINFGINSNYKHGAVMLCHRYAEFTNMFFNFKTKPLLFLQQCVKAVFGNNDLLKELNEIVDAQQPRDPILNIYDLNSKNCTNVLEWMTSYYRYNNVSSGSMVIPDIILLDKEQHNHQKWDQDFLMPSAFNLFAKQSGYRIADFDYKPLQMQAADSDWGSDWDSSDSEEIDPDQMLFPVAGNKAIDLRLPGLEKVLKSTGMSLKALKSEIRDCPFNFLIEDYPEIENLVVPYGDNKNIWKPGDLITCYSGLNLPPIFLDDVLDTDCIVETSCLQENFDSYYKQDVIEICNAPVTNSSKSTSLPVIWILCGRKKFRKMLIDRFKLSHYNISSSLHQQQLYVRYKGKWVSDPQDMLLLKAFEPTGDLEIADKEIAETVIGHGIDDQFLTRYKQVKNKKEFLKKISFLLEEINPTISRLVVERFDDFSETEIDRWLSKYFVKKEIDFKQELINILSTKEIMDFVFRGVKNTDLELVSDAISEYPRGMERKGENISIFGSGDPCFLSLKSILGRHTDDLNQGKIRLTLKEAEYITQLVYKIEDTLLKVQTNDPIAGANDVKTMEFFLSVLSVVETEDREDDKELLSTIAELGFEHYRIRSPLFRATTKISWKSPPSVFK